MPIYESQNLIFREINAGDVTEEMVSDLNDREYMKYSNNRFMRHTISSQLRYLESFVNSSNQYVGGFFKETSDLAVTLTFS